MATELDALVERPMLRVCPVRDAICPHGMACPYTAGWDCSDPTLRGRSGYIELPATHQEERDRG